MKVQEVGTDHDLDFAKIVCDAFDLGDEATPWLAKLPGRPDWHIFMGFDRKQPTGVGALFVQNGIGWTDWGATAHEFRRRGGQGALLEVRVERALEMGCRSIFTCT